ncbi:hypothetical protein [[Acholeplasma] multilocale]|uniref:hypothetical protein n=1 Tax=[Acholeplasma] multilocale TaxID=264638 RepID=UPI00047A3AA9|nr:hypothetical protein [[Acholeplasma] multilocale]
MNNLNINVYATLEIKNKILVFTVSKYIGNKLMVIFTGEKVNEKGWLNSKGEVIDIVKAGKELTAMINEFETTHFGLKIFRVMLILPNNNIQVRLNSGTIDVRNEQQKPVLIKKDHIKELTADIKTKNAIDGNTVLSHERVQLTADGQVSELSGINKLPTSILGMTLRTVEVPTKVLESHKRVVAKANRDATMFATTNINAMYYSVSNVETKNKPMLIVNWKTNSTEIGYFSNGNLVKFVKMKKSITTVIKKVAKKMKISNESAKDYIFNIMDHSSTNNDESVVFAKWNNDTRILEKMKGSSVTEMISLIINSIYSEIKDVLKETINLGDFITYNFGMIQNIPGANKIIKNGKALSNDYVYEENTFGSTNNRLAATIGAVKEVKRRNDNMPNKVITSVGLTKNINVEENTNSKGFGNVFGNQIKPSYNQALFLNNDGIVIDSKKIRNK